MFGKIGEKHELTRIAGTIFLLLTLAGSVFAEDITFEVTVDMTEVSLGESTQLNLSFYGTQEVPTPYFPGAG